MPQHDPEDCPDYNFNEIEHLITRLTKQIKKEKYVEAEVTLAELLTHVKRFREEKQNALPTNS